MLLFGHHVPWFGGRFAAGDEGLADESAQSFVPEGEHSFVQEVTQLPPSTFYRAGDKGAVLCDS